MFDFRIRRMGLLGGLAIGLGAGLLPAAAQAERGYGRGWSGEIVLCESHRGREAWCPADTRGGVRLLRQHSNASCIEGRTWGWDRRGIWVAGGCRAEFAAHGGHPGRGHGRGHGRGRGGAIGIHPVFVTCESHRGRTQWCDAPLGRGGVRLVEQYSRAACIEGRTWGWDRRGIWVADGCRGEFAVY
ncbi:MAG: DUF3011 domain-containing protein [Rehaibacterium terrae]|uniref:DUF3011 domain-containing protein n=1 Tax=Rehaibacterium terrae TaxID=1341696 RepID=UPI003919DD40